MDLFQTGAILPVRQRNFTPTLRYGFVLLSLALATLITSLIPAVTRIPFSLFFAATLLSVFYAGLRAAILAIGLSALIVNYLFTPPRNQFIFDFDGTLQMAVFVAVTGIVCLLIDRHKRAERKATLAHEQLSFLIESLPVVPYAMRSARDQSTTYVSDGVKQVTGYDPKMFHNDSSFWSQRLHPEDCDRVIAKARELISEGASYQEYRWRIADGSYKWFGDWGRLVKSADGLADRVVGTWVDVSDRKQAENAIRESRERLVRMVRAAQVGISFATSGGEILDANNAFLKLVGYSLEELRTLGWKELTPPEYAELDRQAIAQLERTGSAQQYEKQYVRRDGARVPVLVNGCRLDPAKDEYVVFVIDITDRKQAEDALFEQKERALVTLNSIGDAVITTDTAGRVTFLNPVAETLTGWRNVEAYGRPLTQVFRIVDGATREPAQNPVDIALRDNQMVGLAMNSVLIRRDGSEAVIEDSAAPIHDRLGKVVGVVMVFHDVTESRAMALKMSHLAQHDFLTGLPNRVLLQDRLTQAIALAQRHHKKFALLFLDLDRFKHINDSLGHAMGDNLLQAVATRLVAAVRHSDTVSRQGGDEFMVLLSEIEHSEDAARVAENLLSAAAAPYVIDGHELHVSMSIGISIYPDSGDDADTLARSADAAMYHAKEEGRNNYQLFSADINARTMQEASLEASLRQALKRGEFVLYYQPKINIASGKMIGCEALIRWQRPDRGLTLPGQFIPLAEENGLIVPIGEWVLWEACRQNRVWCEAGLDPTSVSVNISALQFRDKDFLRKVRRILDETGLRPQYLDLELTESIIMDKVETTQRLLHSLKSMGIELSIDDFGTGYSSLSYLKRLPIDTLKIDQSFVQDLPADVDSAAITTAVISMARTLKQRVVAEGVETGEQAAFLRAQGCHEMQGYYFSQPLLPEEFAAFSGAMS